MRTLTVAINPTASFGRGREVGPPVVALLRERGHVVHELIASSLDVDGIRRSLQLSAKNSRALARNQPQHRRYIGTLHV